MARTPWKKQGRALTTSLTASPPRSCAQVAAFAPEYWGGDLYLDGSKAFYAAAHGGAIRRGSLLDLLNPWSQ